jgi:uncharacterized paraquat-inducible protein A
VEVLDSDSTTTKQQPGRPRKECLCMQSRYLNPKDSKIKCSICGKGGHNKKTHKTRNVAEPIVAKNKKDNSKPEGSTAAALVQLDTEASPN